MNNEFLKAKFVADAVMAYMRDANFPNDSQAAYLDARPLIDALRGRIEPEDISIHLDIINKQAAQAAGLSISLLRLHNKINSDILKCFEDRWKTANPYLRNRIMWRMLDIKDSAFIEKWREELAEFVFSEWNTFRDFNLKFYGGPNQVISSMLSRFGDTTFPDSKKWVYLCSAIEVVDDPNAARAIVNMGLNMSDDFTRSVAGKLLKHFFSDKDGSGPVRAPEPETDEHDGIDYVADAVIFSLRAGNLPDEESGDYLNRLPIVDMLRDRINKDDLQWIIEVLEKETGEVAGLFLSLIRKFDLQPDVKSFLRNRWESANAFLKAHLMWRILDDPELPEEWNRKIFDFILAEWETFHKVSLKFLGTPETVVMQALKRIGDPTFPDSKKWSYLCRVPEVASDQESAKALVSMGLTMKDPFAREVAGILLERFFPSK